MPTPSELRLRRLQAEAYLNLSRIHRIMERRVAELFEQEGLDDLTPAQANVLTLLFQAREPLTARQLAQLMSLSEVTVGRFVRALENAGWVERNEDPSDSRAMLIRLTKKAYKTFPKLVRVSNTLLDEAFAGFGARDVERVVETIIDIRKNIDAGSELVGEPE